MCLRKILFQISKNVYGDFPDVTTGLWRDCLSRTQRHKGFQHFKSGRTSIEDDAKYGQPSTSMNDHVGNVLAVICQNRCQTVREVAEQVGICKSSCHLILTENQKMSYCRKICVASADASHLIHEFLTKHEMTLVPQLPYSPDLAPADFLLFLKWKSSLKGCQFQAVEETEENSIWDICAVPQNMFHDAFQK